MIGRSSLAAIALALAFQGPSAKPVAPRPVERVCVVGASMSNGMEAGEEFSRFLDATITRDHRPVQAKTSIFFFAGPVDQALEQLAFARESDATMIVGVDFLFWFGYGLQNAEGEPLASEDERLPLLEKGLSLLDPFECPIVVGDFPDMSDAIGTMLLEGQVPAPETRAALNARLREWAGKKKNVVLLPLDRVMAKLRVGEAVEIGRHEWPAGSDDLLLRPDHLHPTVEGQIAVANMVASALVDAKLATADDVDLDVASVFERLGEPMPEGIGH